MGGVSLPSATASIPSGPVVRRCWTPPRAYRKPYGCRSSFCLRRTYFHLPVPPCHRVHTLSLPTLPAPCLPASCAQTIPSVPLPGRAHSLLACAHLLTALSPSLAPLPVPGYSPSWAKENTLLVHACYPYLPHHTLPFLPQTFSFHIFFTAHHVSSAIGGGGWLTLFRRMVGSSYCQPAALPASCHPPSADRSPVPFSAILPVLFCTYHAPCHCLVSLPLLDPSCLQWRKRVTLPVPGTILCHAWFMPLHLSIMPTLPFLRRELPYALPQPPFHTACAVPDLPRSCCTCQVDIRVTAYATAGHTAYTPYQRTIYSWFYGTRPGANARGTRWRGAAYVGAARGAGTCGATGRRLGAHENHEPSFCRRALLLWL